MEMSVGVLDHYNVSTRKLKETAFTLQTRYTAERAARHALMNRANREVVQSTATLMGLELLFHKLTEMFPASMLWRA
jgi:hypothetical protein